MPGSRRRALGRASKPAEPRLRHAVLAATPCFWTAAGKSDHSLRGAQLVKGTYESRIHVLGRCDDGDGPGELADSDDEEEPPPRPVHDLVNDEDDVDPMECIICNNGLHDSFFGVTWRHSYLRRCT